MEPGGGNRDTQINFNRDTGMHKSSGAYMLRLRKAAWILYAGILTVMTAGLLLLFVTHNLSHAGLYPLWFGGFIAIVIIAAVYHRTSGRLLLGLQQKIFEESQSTEAARLYQEQYRSTVDAMIDKIHVIDREHTIILINRSFLAWAPSFGLSSEREDYLGRSLFDIFPFLPVSVMAEYQSVFETGSAISTSESFSFGGKTVFTETSKIPVIEHGRVVRIVTAIRDITDAKRAVEEHARVSERFRNIVERSPFPIAILNAKNRIEYLNPKFNTLFGYSIEDIHDDVTFFQAAYPDIPVRQVEYDMWLAAAGAGEKRLPGPHRTSITCRDGSEKNVIVMLVRMEDGQKFVIFEDYTERNNLESQLLHSQKMEAIGRLAGGIAHDFNNILTSIMGYTSILMNSCRESDREHRELGQIMKSSEMAASLTRQLLAFSRKQVLKPSVIDLNALVDGIRMILQRIIGEDIELVTEMSENTPPVIADPAQIEQVLMNLAVNAYDSMSAGGVLTIRTGRITAREKTGAREFATITVSDTGKGIDRTIIDKIFEPFFSTKDPSKGTGLGLSVVYGIVTQHGGFISVTSDPGSGSMFTVKLPAHFTPHADTAQEKRDPASFMGNGETILFVEDEEGVRVSVARILEKYGYRVITATNAGEALTLFETNRSRIVLVFSDVVMPGISGTELAEILASKDPTLPILLGSGYTDEKSQWAFIQERGYHFIQKPYKFDHILATVAGLIRNSPFTEN